MKLRKIARQAAVLSVMIGLVFTASVLLIVFVIISLPAVGWPQGFRIVGLMMNVTGALVSLVPRAFREKDQIENQARMYFGGNPHAIRALHRDTVIAQVGMVLLLVGFTQQLIGNLLS